MGFTDRKLEIAIFALSITMIGGLGYVLKTPVQNAILSGDITYEMPRIKKSFLASLFDLGDREVDRSYTNPFAKKKAEDKKKAEEAKKAQAAAAAKAATKAVAKKAEEAKKPKVSVNTVEGNPTKKWGDDGFFGAGNARAAYANNGGNNAPAAADGAGDDADGMSGDQWYALLMAEPTAANVSKLIAAFSSKEVDAETYYRIVDGLYKSNNTDTQKLGLVAAKAFYNTQSFMVTTQHYEQFPAEVQSGALSYLKSYATSGRLSILAAVIQSNDLASVTMATDVILEGYQNAKNGTTPVSTDPRTSRGNVATNSVSGYSQFHDIFAKLADSSDAAIRAIAVNALAQLPQSTVASL